MLKTSQPKDYNKDYLIFYCFFHRPLDTENEANFCLAVPAKAMSEVWDFDRKNEAYRINFSLTVENPTLPLFPPPPPPPTKYPPSTSREKISVYLPY